MKPDLEALGSSWAARLPHEGDIELQLEGREQVILRCIRQGQWLKEASAKPRLIVKIHIDDAAAIAEGLLGIEAAVSSQKLRLRGDIAWGWSLLQRLRDS